MKRLLKWLIVIAIFVAVAIASFYQWNYRKPLKYVDCLSEEAFSLDGESVPMSELALYIIYEERAVEEQAMIYNPDNTRDYWNAHANGQFIRVAAKKAVMGMAVHTRLLCRMAKEEGVSLDADEERAYRDELQDFWMDMLDEQRERMPVSDEYIYQEMRNIAIAEKYQKILQQRGGGDMASYNWDGRYYEKILEEHDLRINKSIWDRISIGDITISHGRVNYINGLRDDE